MNTATGDLLHVLGYLYLRCGQNRRALYLMRLADVVTPADEGIKRTLAYACLVNEAPQEALDVIAQFDAGGARDAMASLLRGRALLQLGRVAEARAHFQSYVEQRGWKPEAHQVGSLEPQARGAS